MEETPMIESFKSSVSISQMLEYLEDSHVDIILNPNAIPEDQLVLIPTEPRSDVFKIQQVEPKNFISKRIHLPEDSAGLREFIRDYRNFNYNFSIVPSDCQECYNNPRIEDLFVWSKKDQNFKAYELGIGCYPYCREFCRKYLDTATSCGEYSGKKAIYVRDRSNFHRLFTLSLLLNRLGVKNI